MARVVIDFDNDSAAEHFAHWLSGQGEQDYWLWMAYREEEEDGPITALRFLYGDYRLNSNGALFIHTETGRQHGD